MKNQSFHQRRIRIQETPKLDFDQVKARTVTALSKLGQQKFSTEPGGYTLDNWTKGVNVLLDEFEEKAGAARLSPVYTAKRQELNDYLSKPVSTSSIDSEMSELRVNISGIVDKIEAERARTTSKASELRAEEGRLAAELERERRRVAGSAAVQNNGSFFNRLLGRPSPAKTSENRIKEIESKIASLQDELLDLQKHLKTIDVRSPGSPFGEDWGRIETMQNGLKELEEKRLDATQLVKERVEMTASIADAISRMP